MYNEKKPSILNKHREKKPEDCIDIADKKINKKPPNLIGTEEEN